METIRILLLLPFIILVLFAVLSEGLRRKNPKKYEELIKDANKEDNDN